MQVLDNAHHTDGANPLSSAGACYGLYPPSQDVTRPVGAWNDDSDLERLLAAIAPDTRSWRGERAAAEERA